LSPHVGMEGRESTCLREEAGPLPTTQTQCSLLLRLFKLKKRYRNVLDTMFELLPRMARYCPPLRVQVQVT
jgi:hypothetical protein